MRGHRKESPKISPKDQYAMRAIEERVAWHTVVIDPSIKEMKWGTGTLLVFQNKKYLLTCEHVIGRFGGKYLHILYRHTKPLEYCENKEWTKHIPGALISKTFPMSIPIENIYYGDEAEDLALIEIKNSSDITRDLEFYTLPDEQVAKANLRTKVFLTGFSQELSRIQSKGKVAFVGLFPYFYAGKIVRKVRPKKINYDAKRHFLVDYPLDSEAADPVGFSGAGIWSRKPSGTGNLWHPNIFLLGVQQSVSRPSQVLKATKIDRVYGILKSIK